MIANFTLDQLIQEIRKLATDWPNFVYERCGSACNYTKSKNNPNKGCIFGQAILNLQPDLKELLTNNNSTPITTVLLNLLDFEYKQEVNGNKISWCAEVQNKQDYGQSWANAIKLSDERYPIGN